MKLSDETKDVLYLALTKAFNDAESIFQCEKVHRAAVEVGMTDLAESFISDMRDLERGKDFPLI
jgi:hypothetical protein